MPNIAHLNSAWPGLGSLDEQKQREGRIGRDWRGQRDGQGEKKRVGRDESELTGDAQRIVQWDSLNNGNYIIGIGICRAKSAASLTLRTTPPLSRGTITSNTLAMFGSSTVTPRSHWPNCSLHQFHFTQFAILTIAQVLVATALIRS